jgi:hypothetical protein
MKRYLVTLSFLVIAVAVDMQRLIASFSSILLTLMVKGSTFVLSFTSTLEPKLKEASDGCKSRAKATWSSKEQ